MAPASASLLRAASSNAGAKRPFGDDSTPGAAEQEQPLAQESAVTKKNGQNQQPKLECPRCSSTDTKFCYYNNYSTAQPRHYCRTCRRYWTHGGTLRKVPVGGACRRGSGSSKRRRSSAEPHTPSSDSPQPELQETRFLSDHPLPVLPFLTDGAVFLPQFDLGLGGFPWTSTTTDHLYDGLGLAAPWGGCDGAWDGRTWVASSSPGHRRHPRRPATDWGGVIISVSQCAAGAFEAPVLSSQPRWIS